MNKSHIELLVLIPFPPPPPPLSYSPYQGYFSLLALAHGCRVVAFEPQAVLWPFIANSLQLNSFNPENLALVPCALSSADSQPGDCLLANEHPNWGEFSLVKSQVGGNVQVLRLVNGAAGIGLSVPNVLFLLSCVRSGTKRTKNLQIARAFIPRPSTLWLRRSAPSNVS
jgi:hypothetical protein